MHNCISHSITGSIAYFHLRKNWTEKYGTSLRRKMKSLWPVYHNAQSTFILSENVFLSFFKQLGLNFLNSQARSHLANQRTPRKWAASHGRTPTGESWGPTRCRPALVRWSPPLDTTGTPRSGIAASPRPSSPRPSGNGTPPPKDQKWTFKGEDRKRCFKQTEAPRHEIRAEHL